MQTKRNNTLSSLQKAGGKLTGNYAGFDDDDEPKKKRRKITTHHVKPTVGARFKGVDASTVTKVCHIFFNMSLIKLIFAYL